MKTFSTFATWMLFSSFVFAGIPPIPEPGKVMMGKISLPNGTSVQPSSMTASIKEADSDKTLTLTIGNGIEVKQVDNVWWYILRLPFATSQINGQTLDAVGPDQFEFSSAVKTYTRAGSTAAFIKVNNVVASMTNSSFNFPSTSGVLAERGNVELVNLTVATAKGPPVVNTGGASGLTTAGASLSGTVNPSDTTTTYYFEYGTTTGYGSKTPNQTVTGISEVNVVAVLTNLQSSTTYHFRIVASNASGSTAGPDQIFTTLTALPPSFVTAPVSQIVPIGTNIGFSATVTGLPEPVLQWFKNDVSVGTGTSYTIASTTTASGGIYTVKATNSVKTESVSAKLGVISIANSVIPVVNGGTFTATLAAAGPGLMFRWSKDGNELSDGESISGATTAKLTVKSMKATDEGAYTCMVSMDSLYRSSGVFTAKVASKPELDSIALGPWYVSKTVTDAITARNIPTKFTIKGLPSGVILNTATGQLSGKPRQSGNFKLTITASNGAGTSLPLSVNVLVDSLPTQVTGLFNGLVRPDADFTKRFGTDFTATVAASGIVSGKIILPSETLTYTSSLEVVEDSDPTVTISIRRVSGRPTVTLTYAINRTTGELTGTITDGNISSPLPVLAQRHEFVKATTNVYEGTNYKFGFCSIDSPDSFTPGGWGYATMTISKKGNVKIIGKLSDGSAFTRATTLGWNGQVPVFAIPYANKTGTVNGWIQVHAKAEAPAENSVDGTLAWVKAVQPVKPVIYNYANGILPHDLTVTGGRYFAPAKNHMILGLETLSSTLLYNAKLNFTYGGIETSSRWDDGSGDLLEGHKLAVSLAHKIKASLPNVAGLSFTVTPSTGAITGSFKLSDPDINDKIITRTVKFYGQIIPGTDSGRGFFLLPDLPEPGIPVSKSPLHSGRFEFSPYAE